MCLRNLNSFFLILAIGIGVSPFFLKDSSLSDSSIHGFPIIESHILCRVTSSSVMKLFSIHDDIIGPTVHCSSALFFSFRATFSCFFVLCLASDMFFSLLLRAFKVLCQIFSLVKRNCLNI